MVTDSSPPPSDTDPIANGGAHLSPQSRRRSLPSPWASVVRGDPEPNAPPAPAAAASASASASTSSPPMEEALSSDNSESQPENGDSNARRPVWNRPLNGVVEPVTVMGGAVSWPALSETTRSVPRSSSDASRIVSDGSVPSSQVTAPIISQPPQRSSHNNANNVHGNSGGNNPNPARLRRNRGGGASGGVGRGSFSVSGPSQGLFNQPPLPMPPPFPVFEVPFGVIPTVLDNSVRGPRPIGGGVGPSHSGNDHSTQRINTRRNNNYGPRPRGDGQYHNNHGGRRDHDRREVHHPPPPYAPPPMGYMPPPLPPGAASFMAPPPMMLFPGQMGFNMESPFIYVPPMPPVIFPPANENPLPNPNLSPNPLPNMIVNQIDYYFSDANLVKDPYLKSKMDDNGWVPISLVASFPRVQRLTNDVPLIVESLRHHSTAVEIQGDMIRRRNDWSLWIGSNGDPSSSGSISAPENALAASLNEVSVDDATTHVNGNLGDAREGRLEMADGQLPEDSTI
ncbi:la-related protein 1C-like isoform X1 [Salvia splendens]|uniref:la-related protein 1C-like isoform X1 n=1 Tax=Salvia splendens TaxID=180675 RepID=UPI001C26E4A1|nr:la-related protein 1C-like isoform X1 [Salvia splendens]XP_042058282.1 la-related protein 1C-like isoform X1 [Salvia splendens]